MPKPEPVSLSSAVPALHIPIKYLWILHQRGLVAQEIDRKEETANTFAAKKKSLNFPQQAKMRAKLPRFEPGTQREDET